MSKPILDIIVTHYDEPWTVGRKFFDMIEHQQCFDKSLITVTLVQDGPETALPWKELLSQYSFRTRIITIKHSGMAEARNAGIEHTSSDWIMFCDFDDMFSDVSSLAMMLDVLPTSDYDILWGAYCCEEKYINKYTYINKVESNFTTVYNKLYRRQYLDEKHIRFNPKLPLHSDIIFNTIAIAETPPFRVGTITTSFYTYFKTLRENSMTTSPGAQEEKLFTVFDRDVLLTNLLRKRGLRHSLAIQVAKTLYDAYYMVVDVTAANSTKQPLVNIKEYYRKYRKVYESLSETEREVVKDTAETEMMNYIQNQFNGFGNEYTFINEDIDFDAWLNRVDPITSPLPVPAVQKPKPTVKKQVYNRDDKVVVFCGTYNTYVNMMASAKSLLYHTPVDRIYFLIEDDTFPYELPDIIETINIKNHPLLKLFDTNGPNYNNSWTYMCLTRAIFSKLFPQYKKILSLDIDIIIKDDISDMWDIDMSDAYIAGVPEPQRQKSTDDPVYINFGVVMMNLDKIRTDGTDDAIIQALNRNKFGCPEQDAFNRYCAGHIVQLPNDLNVTVFSHITGEAQKERILHYAGIKYWRHFAPVREYADMNWTEVMNRQQAMKGEAHA